MKNSLERLSSILVLAKEQSILENKSIEIIHFEEDKEKRIEKVSRASWTFGKLSSVPTTICIIEMAIQLPDKIGFKT